MKEPRRLRSPDGVVHYQSFVQHDSIITYCEYTDGDLYIVERYASSDLHPTRKIPSCFVCIARASR